MCLTIPGQVVAVKNEHATVNYGRYGMKMANSVLVHPEVGDYVLVQGGFIIKVLPTHEAEEALRVWEQVRSHMDDADAGAF